MFCSMMLFPDEPQRAEIKLHRRGETLLEYCEVDGRAILGRVVSSDPKSFLDPLLYPGADITGLISKADLNSDIQP